MIKWMERWRRASTITVVLSGEEAFWYRRRAHSGVDTFVERLPRTGETPSSRCPWLACDAGMVVPQRLRVIVDSPLLEVLRVGPDGTIGGPFGVVRRWRLIRQIQRDHPAADIATVPRQAESVFLYRDQWPEAWASWLQSLPASVRIERVVGAVSLLPWLLHVETSGNEDAVLCLLHESRRTRHALVRSGQVQFLRTLPNRRGDDLAQTINETRTHLAAALGVENPGLRVMGVDARQIAHLRGETGLDVQEVDRDVDTPLSTPSLARVLVGALERRRRQGRWTGRVSRRSSGSANPQIHQLRAVRHDTWRLRSLGVATWASVVIATLTVLWASTEALDGIRLTTLRVQEQQRLSDRARTLQARLAERSPQALLSDTLLERFDVLDSAARTNVSDLFALVQEAQQTHPGVLLDTLVWQVIGEPVDDGPLVISTDTAPARAWPMAGNESVHVLEVGGQVAGETGLRQQQALLRAFAETLRSRDRVDYVQLLQTPLSLAVSRPRSSAEESRGDYRLRVGLRDE